MTDFKGSSKKSSINGEVWNPTSKLIKGTDGNDYSTRNPNPAKGHEPKMTGYYLGFDVFTNPKKPEQKPSNSHKFQTAEGEMVKIYGSHDLDKQLAAVTAQDGLGTFCQIQWNGYFVKKKSAGKPEEILKKQLPDDHYHDWEVIAGDHDTYPPIKVEGAEVYKPAPSNVAAEKPNELKPAPTVPVIPEELPTPSGIDESDDLPY